MHRKWKILIAIFATYLLATFIVSDGKKYCRDGSITYSSGRGTCSWHRGQGTQPAKQVVWWVFVGALGVWGYHSFLRSPPPPPQPPSSLSTTTPPTVPQRSQAPAPRRPSKPSRAPQNGLPPCPTCGAEMWVRIAKRGGNRGKRFLGCSSFPRCRGALPFRRGAP